MNTTETKKDDRLPRIICAFAAFFTIAIPTFAICVGRGTHSAWVELAAFLETRGGANPFALALLNNNRAILWALFAIAAVLAFSLFALMRKNSKSSETLTGAGRIVFALGLSAILSAFYLAMLAVCAAMLITPFLR